MAKNDNANIQSGDLTEALGLLTRLPVTSGGVRGARAAWAWPVAGAIIGLLGGMVATLGIWFGMPASVVAGMALTTQIILTGAMHEDGLADCADGFWGGHDRERRLEIMKDSAIGTYGTLALALSILFRWSLITALISQGYLFAPLIAVAALSRVPMAGLMFAMEPARQSGLSTGVGQPDGDTVVLTAAMGLLIGFVFAGFATIPMALAIAGLGWTTARIATTKIGGQTGDVLGASQQITEIGALMVFVWVLA